MAASVATHWYEALLSAEVILKARIITAVSISLIRARTASHASQQVSFDRKSKVRPLLH